MLKVLFVICVCLCVCSGQVLQFGTCANVETMKYFEMEKFRGMWYEAQRFPTWYEEYGQCAYKTFDTCGRRLEVAHGYVRDGVQYVLHINTTYAPGDEAVFEIPENNIDPVGIPLSVIDTDYVNYAVIYGCKSNNALHLKYLSAWILTRNPSIDDETLLKAQKILVTKTSSSTVYLETVHHNQDLCNSHWTAHIYAKFYNDTYNYDQPVSTRHRTHIL